jgi:hypothetical protein
VTSDESIDDLDSRAGLRVELLRIVRAQADRAHTRRGHESLDELRKRSYAMLIRASADGILPPDADLQAVADLIAGAVWSRVVLGEEISDAHAAAVVEAVLPHSA